MTIPELKEAIVALPAEELAYFAHWFEQFRANRWDEQIARDARAGRFDALIQEAKKQEVAGQSRTLVPGKSLVP